MECKTQFTQHHKLNRLMDGNIENPSKQKKKTKERKELWDSLLQVYEKEADKENVEDVSVADIEQWTITHHKDSPRAFPLINPTIIFNSLPGTVADNKTAPSKPSVNTKQVGQGRKRKKDTALKETNFGLSSSKTKKKNCSLKKTSKHKPNVENSGTEEITTILNEKQKLKSKGKSKNQKKIVNNSANLGKKKITTGLNENQKLKPKDKSEYQKKLVNNSTNLGIKKRRNSVKSSDLKVKKIRSTTLEKVESLKGNGLQHEQYEHTCNLTLSYYSNEEIPSTREDGRVFRCKLVLRVCECVESDEVF